MISRRGVIRSCASMAMLLPVRKLTAEPQGPGLAVRLDQEFPQSVRKALTPDGTRLCLEDWSAPGYPLRVVELGTWRTIYTGRFQARVLAADFFADSRGLFMQLPPRTGAVENLETVVDIQTTVRLEQMRRHDYFRESEAIYPTRDRMLLVA